MIRIRRKIAESGRQCDEWNAALRSRPPESLPPWAVEILHLAADMHGETWRAAWRECRKLLPKDRQQYLGRHHVPKKAAFRCWLAGEVVIPDGWKVGP